MVSRLRANVATGQSYWRPHFFLCLLLSGLHYAWGSHNFSFVKIEVLIPLCSKTTKKKHHWEILRYGQGFVTANFVIAKVHCIFKTKMQNLKNMENWLLTPLLIYSLTLQILKYSSPFPCIKRMQPFQATEGYIVLWTIDDRPLGFLDYSFILLTLECLLTVKKKVKWDIIKTSEFIVKSINI